MNVVAIVLAAGSSSRMGRPKQLLPVDGTPMVRRVAEAALASRVRQTIVVTGAAREQVEDALAGLPLHLVYNPDYLEGLSTSLRAGLRAARPEMDAAIILLADQPFVDAAVIDALIDLYEAAHGRIVRPRYGGQPGNPVLWDRSLFDALMAQEGDQGGRQLLQEHASEIVWLDLPDPRLQLDVDTPEAYDAVVHTAEAGASAQEAGAPAPSRVPADEAANQAGPDHAAPPADQETVAAHAPEAPAADSAAHLEAEGARFCQRCGSRLVLQPIEYAGGRLRPACPACGFVVWNDPKVAALTVIAWDGGILLGRRGQSPGKGRWSFPSGFVDRGEVVEEAARRETLEETGLDVEIVGLVGVYSEPGNPVIVVAYAAEPRGGTLRADDDLEELRAFSPDALPEMAFGHDDRIVRDWLALRARHRPKRDEQIG